MSPYSMQQPELHIAGVHTRTTNAEEAGPNGRLPALWATYFQQQGTLRDATHAPERLYAVYTEYESDATGAYTVVIGHEEVDDATRAQHDLKSAVLPKSNYLVFLTKKGPVQDVVPQAWADIWAYFQSAPEQRSYMGDFELYETRDFDPAHAEVQIYIAIR